MPGSPFNDEKLTADQIAMMSKKYGLDKPLIVQLFTYVKNLLQVCMILVYRRCMLSPGIRSISAPR
ncbi:MAG: hypothetical protein ACLR8P_21620 [Clostridium fessum]